MFFAIVLFPVWWFFGQVGKKTQKNKKFGRKNVKPKAAVYRRRPKPQWVRRKVIYLKAMMPGYGCRKIAAVFNRRYERTKNMTVSKTFVNYVIRNSRYEIQLVRRKIKHKRPVETSHNLIWGIDLTGKADKDKNMHSIFGVVEHHSRACLCLQGLKDKGAISLLRILLDLVEKYKKPKIIRTDNEAVFKSRLFNIGLWLLGIKHQYTELHCPWQNGRIERFFGTLKQKLNQWSVADFEELNNSIRIFRIWYNQVRPHQNLSGMTPAEVWKGETEYPVGERFWFSAWDGLLTGDFYHPK